VLGRHSNRAGGGLQVSPETNWEVLLVLIGQGTGSPGPVYRTGNKGCFLDQCIGTLEHGFGSGTWAFLEQSGFGFQ
jgi:hypothetical protein